MTRLLLILISFLGFCSLQGQDLKELKNISELFSYCSDEKFVVFGEAHGIEVINDIRLENIKYNLQRGRKTHLLLEMGASSEKAFNDFLFTDNNNVTPFLRFPKSFMDSLKILVNQYPAQLMVHGIDVETSLSLYIEHLQLLEELIVDETLKKKIFNLLPHKVLSKKEKKKKRKKIKQVLEACADYFDKENIENSFATNLIKQGRESFFASDKGLIKGAQFRDNLMYENIQQLVRSFPDAYFYMQIGAHHAYSYTDKTNWKGGLTEMLNSTPTSLVYKKVFSIGQGVVACQSARQEDIYTELEIFPLQINKEVIDYFKKEKWEVPVCYTWQPKELNSFNLYLITIGYDKEERKRPKNNLHLIFN